MNIKGIERERQRFKRRYGMRVSGAGMKRIQLALLERLASRAERPKASPKPRPQRRRR